MRSFSSHLGGGPPTSGATQCCRGSERDQAERTSSTPPGGSSSEGQANPPRPPGESRAHDLRRGVRHRAQAWVAQRLDVPVSSALSASWLSLRSALGLDGRRMATRGTSVEVTDRRLSSRTRVLIGLGVMLAMAFVVATTALLLRARSIRRRTDSALAEAVTLRDTTSSKRPRSRSSGHTFTRNGDDRSSSSTATPSIPSAARLPVRRRLLSRTAGAMRSASNGPVRSTQVGTCGRADRMASTTTVKATTSS